MIDVDGVRARDLNVFAALALVLAAGLALVAFRNAAGLVLGFSGVDVDTTLGAALGAVVLTGFVYQHAKPDFDGVCEACGDRITVNASSEGEGSMVIVRKAGDPRRMQVGPISLVTETQRVERDYCSPECAERDEIPLMPVAEATESSEIEQSVVTEGDD